MKESLRSLKYSQIPAFPRHTFRSSPAFLPIELCGGIGDVILNIDAIEFLAKRFNIGVYTKHYEVFKYFSDIPVLPGPIPDYKWHLELSSVSKFVISNQFAGFELEEHRKLFDQQQKLFLENPYLEVLVRSHPQMSSHLADYAKTHNFDRRTSPLYTLGYTDKIPHRMISNNEPKEDIITIHSGCDISMRIKGVSTKQWPTKHWESLVKMIRESFPDFRIIQLGARNSAIIKGAESLVGELSISKSFDLLKRSALHIDGDSGLVHAAARMKVPSVVLWGPTSEFYAYRQNINLRNPDSCEGNCFWVKDKWMENCPIGYSSCKAMSSISPESVMEDVRTSLICNIIEE